MSNLHARSFFFVADAERSLRFYTEQLGFTLAWDTNNELFFWLPYDDFTNL